MNVALLLARWLRLLPSRTKVVVRESTTPSVFVRQGTNHPHVWTMFYRRLYPRADAVICLSDAMKKDLAANFAIPPQKLVKIYNPVDIERIRQAASSGGSPYSGAGPHLAAAGRFGREKGFDLLLDALPQVLAAYPQAQLALLGDGPCDAALRAQAEKLGVAGAVSFPGMQQNPWRYFLHADLVLVPSRYDGLPNVPLEALAVGAQVVATDCPGAIREISGSAQITLVSPESPGALAEGMLAALAQRRKSSAEPAKSGGELLANFNLNDVVEQYSRLLSED
jgi:glycosyltransferase involved in cell wall biosynthesis